MTQTGGLGQAGNGVGVGERGSNVLLESYHLKLNKSFSQGDLNEIK